MLIAAGIVLLSLGRPLLGLGSQLCCVAAITLGIFLIYQARRQRWLNEALDEWHLAPGDGDYLSGSHHPDLPDDD